MMWGWLRTAMGRRGPNLLHLRLPSDGGAAAGEAEVERAAALDRLGFTVEARGPAEFAPFQAAELRRVEEVIRAAKLSRAEG